MLQGVQRNLLHFQRALYLRKKKGYSYSEIREEVPVAKSTLSLWLRGIELSHDQQESIYERGLFKLREHHKKFNLGEWNREKRQAEVTKIRVDAKNNAGLMTDREHFISGIMLYWAEGSKGGKSVEITNADPIFVLFIMQWFRNCLGISEDRFTATIHYHVGQNEQKIIEFWSKLAGIPIDNFRKSFCKPPGTGHRKHYLQWGVIRIRIRRSADLFHKISGWRDGLIQARLSATQRGRP